MKGWQHPLTDSCGQEGCVPPKARPGRGITERAKNDMYVYLSTVEGKLCRRAGYQGCLSAVRKAGIC